MAEYKLKYTGAQIDEKLDKVEQLSREIVDQVKGDGIKNIVRKTQAEYDAMASHDANTLYVIVG